MTKTLLSLFSFFISGILSAQLPGTSFEKSGGMESATYQEAIHFFKKASAQSPLIALQEIGTTDAGYPLHLVLVSPDGIFDPAKWKAAGKVVILVNNSIHPGEPDGTDASMLLVRDIVNGKIKIPGRVRLAIIPVYNIGGALNRGPYSRVNQNGPKEYGFRGNAQYLDLNRDFTKMDSRNAASFAQIFHLVDPHLFIDNHVSDGADFQHTMTLIATQYDKLGGDLGNWLRSSFEPAVYRQMQVKGWDVFPYVNFNAYDLSRGMTQFYDPPRYSTGYTALFQTIGFMPETHMLKPYKDRVKSTYDLMLSMMVTANAKADSILTLRRQLREQVMQQKTFPLSWTPDTGRHTLLTFKGYERDTTISEVTGLPRMYYRRDKPFDAEIKFLCFFTGQEMIQKPKAYIIPQGWYRVHEKLKLNGVPMQQMRRDTIMELEVYQIESYTPATRPYEGHFRHSNVKVKPTREKTKVLKGDYIVPMGHYTDRFVIEMLEPTGADSYFCWNIFDAILQQKEGYSNYRWEEVAAEWLRSNPEISRELEAKKKAEPDFAKNPNQILNWVYRKSPYFEPGFMRYPIFRQL